MRNGIFVLLYLLFFTCKAQTECAKDSCIKASLTKSTGITGNPQVICWEIPARFTLHTASGLEVKHPSFESECHWKVDTFDTPKTPKQSVFVLLSLIDGKPQETGWQLVLIN